jgi:hypothetical protein
MKFDAAQPPLANDDRCYTQGFSEAAFSPAMRPKAIASGMLLPPGHRKPKNERKNFLPQISPVLFRGSTPSNPHRGRQRRHCSRHIRNPQRLYLPHDPIFGEAMGWNCRLGVRSERPFLPVIRRQPLLRSVEQTAYVSMNPWHLSFPIKHV